MVKLNKLERAIVSSVLLEDKSDISRRLKMIERRASFVKSEKGKQYISESVKKIRTNINTSEFKESATKTLQLRETVALLLEKESPIFEIKYPDLQYVRKPKLEALDSDSTETVFLTFMIPLYPQGEKYRDVYYEIQKLNRKLSAMGHTVINKLMRIPKNEDGKWPLFTGGGIWESSMPENLNKVGKEVLGRVELAINTTSPTLQELKPEVGQLLVEINNLIPTYFGDSVSAEEQAKTLKGYVAPVSDETDVEDDDTEEKDAWEQPDTEFDVAEKEPSEKDLQKISKQFQLNEKQLKLKNSLEKLSQKKVVFA